MKILDVKQGGVDWFNARLGRPTASHFAAIVLPDGRPTSALAVSLKARRTYAAQLLAERLTGKPTDTFVTPAMQRGTDLEPRGRAYWELERGAKAIVTGFVTTDDGRAGCSPDWLCDGGGGECKCPQDSNLIKLLLADEDDAVSDYAMQVQGCMWVCARPWWDLVLFTDTPGIPNRIIRIERDLELMQAFNEEIYRFCDELDASEKVLRAMGGGVDLGAGLRDQYAELTGEEK